METNTSSASSASSASDTSNTNVRSAEGKVNVRIHKVEPTNIPSDKEVMAVELSRKSKTTGGETIKCFAVLPATILDPADLSADALQQILQDWLNTTRTSAIKSNVRAAYAQQQDTVEVDLSLAGIYEHWQEIQSSGRLNSDSISAWFASSPAASRMATKLSSAGRTPKEIEKILGKVLALFVSCAAPVPAISASEAEKLLPYLEGDNQQVAVIISRKLTNILKKVSSLDLGDLA